MSDKTKQMKGFLIYYDNEVIVCRLPDEEAGQLFKSLFPYAKESIKPNFDDSPALAMAFDILSMAIDKDKENYLAKCEKNRRNIEKRWNKDNTTVYDGIPLDTKDTNTNSNNNTSNNNNNITHSIIHNGVIHNEEVVHSSPEQVQETKDCMNNLYKMITGKE